MPYFLSAEFSLLDCSIAPILWRLPHYGIELPTSTKPITTYMKRVFRVPHSRPVSPSKSGTWSPDRCGHAMTSSKPYLVRALYQWILDNDNTPYILVDTSSEQVLIPTGSPAMARSC